MKCDKLPKLMIDLLGGEISLNDKEILEKHIASCEKCRLEFAELRKSWELTQKALNLDSFSESLSEEHLDNIKKKVSSTKIFTVTSSEKKRKPFLSFSILEIAACFLILGFLAVILLPALLSRKEMSARAYDKRITSGAELREQDGGAAGTSSGPIPLGEMGADDQSDLDADAPQAQVLQDSGAISGKDNSNAEGYAQSNSRSRKLEEASDKVTAKTGSAEFREKAEFAAPGKESMKQLNEPVPSIEIAAQEAPAPLVAEGKVSGYGGAAAVKSKKAAEMEVSHDRARKPTAAPEKLQRAAAGEKKMALQSADISVDNEKKMLSDIAPSAKPRESSATAPSSSPIPSDRRDVSDKKAPVAKQDALRQEEQVLVTDELNVTPSASEMHASKNSNKIVLDDNLETMSFPFKKDIYKQIAGSNEELVKYFKTQGVTFGNGAIIIFDERTENLTIRNDPANIKKSEEIINKLNYHNQEKDKFKDGLLFNDTKLIPFSTFSIDTDTASYTMARKSLRNGQKPEAESVRPEEFINFFDYHYRSPQNATFAVYVESAPSPFRPQNYTLRIGVQGRKLGPDANKPSVYTILIDSSGSMARDSRIDLVKKTLPVFLDQLKPEDKVSVLSCTHRTYMLINNVPASEKRMITKIVEGILPAGVANIESGLIASYQTALKNYSPGGNNRLILFTDGISNIGSPSAENIMKQVESSREKGISNTIIALGGDGDDVFLEGLAAKGDGNYVYIENEDSARELFVNDFSARFREIARDVKIQVEFNSQNVAAYRQIGYENRQLSKADFRNDKVDAGEVGAGQSVTALYELQLPANRISTDITSSEKNICTVRLRYRRADNMEIEEKEFFFQASDIKKNYGETEPSFKLASSVAEFAEFLRFPDVPGIANPVSIIQETDTLLANTYRNDGKVQEFKSLVQMVK